MQVAGAAHSPLAGCTHQLNVGHPATVSNQQRLRAGNQAPDRLAVQRRLLANAYLLHVTHLTTGMRLGAAAAEKLNLFRVRGCMLW